MIEMFTAIGMVVTAMFLMCIVDEVFQSLRKRFRKPKEETDNTTSESLPGCSTVSFTYYIKSEEKKEEPK